MIHAIGGGENFWRSILELLYRKVTLFQHQGSNLIQVILNDTIIILQSLGKPPRGPKFTSTFTRGALQPEYLSHGFARWRERIQSGFAKSKLRYPWTLHIRYIGREQNKFSHHSFASFCTVCCSWSAKTCCRSHPVIEKSVRRNVSPTYSIILTASQRKRLVPSYTNSMWVSSGQKYKFLRF